jgi:hypothetical protein
MLVLATTCADAEDVPRMAGGDGEPTERASSENAGAPCEDKARAVMPVTNLNIILPLDGLKGELIDDAETAYRPGS